MTLLVTGTAGFIGYHTAQALLARGERVVGVDVVNAYYEVGLKEARLERLRSKPGFFEARIDIAERTALEAVFAAHQPRRVIHLAAQAGVRYSVENPRAYVDSNLVGFANILECCRHAGVEHLVYASTSSVYGANAVMPFAESHGVGHPLSLYAATKRANEVMAHSYAHLFGLPCTGLRFFTVYGPWGRPDMAPILFARAIAEGRPIDVFNSGDMQRDFTYVGDIVECVVRVCDLPAAPDPTWSAGHEHPDPDRSGVAPFRVLNIGRGEPVQLMDFIRLLEENLGRRAQLRMMPMQAGDVSATLADTSAISRLTGFSPRVSIAQGVSLFAEWYRSYYGV